MRLRRPPRSSELTLDSGGPWPKSLPLIVIDPVTKNAYILVKVEVYERLKGLVDDLSPEEAYSADQAFAENWDDPLMADYDHYEDFRE